MTLNGVMAVTLRYFTEFGKTCVAENDLWRNLCKSLFYFSACTTSSQRKFMFAISSPDEFLVVVLLRYISDRIFNSLLIRTALTSFLHLFLMWFNCLISDIMLNYLNSTTTNCFDEFVCE